MKQEIVKYSIDNHTDKILEVCLENETVWLTQTQMMQLFDSTKQNISLHINNIYKEKELEVIRTVKEYLTVQNEGGRNVRRSVKHYNLDVIISVGYRVKSIRGTQFRIWATKVLRDYLLKGYVFQQRLENLEVKVANQEVQLKQIIENTLPPKEGIFYDGQIFDAYVFVSKLIKKARKSVVLIDNFVDETVLVLLGKRKSSVTAKIYTKKQPESFELDLKKYNSQYQKIEIDYIDKCHDRFLIIDNNEVYLIGASLKDLGKKWFAFSRIEIDTDYLIKKLATK